MKWNHRYEEKKDILLLSLDQLIGIKRGSWIDRISVIVKWKSQTDRQTTGNKDEVAQP